MEIFSNSLIIERIKLVINARTDKELAEKIGVNSSTLANWKTPTKTKPTFSEKIFEYAEKNNLDLNWLILGKDQTAQPNAAEQMALTAFAALNSNQQIQAISFMNALALGQTPNTPNGITQTATNSTVGNMVAGNQKG